jgi:hypothetical protein
MIFELRTYETLPGRAPDYLDLFRREGVGLVTRHLPLVGYWLAETGALNTVVHLWAYASLEERDACRRSLGTETAWTHGFIPTAFALVTRQSNRLLRLERANAAFAAAVSARRAVHPCHEPDTPMFADGLMTLTVSAAQPAAEEEGEIALWRAVAGADTGAWLRLEAGAALDPGEGGICGRTLLRPMLLSPVR